MSNERERIEQILHRYDEIIASMADPAIVSDGARYLKLTKELSDIEPVVTRIRDKDRVEKELSEARELHTSADDEEITVPNRLTVGSPAVLTAIPSKKRSRTRPVPKSSCI